MAAQIHMAGRICTSVSLQLVKRSFTPWKSMANAPTNIASGASQRLRWLSASTVLSTIASSPVRMPVIRRSNCVVTVARRDGRGDPATGSSASPGTFSAAMMLNSSVENAQERTAQRVISRVATRSGSRNLSRS